MAEPVYITWSCQNKYKIMRAREFLTEDKKSDIVQIFKDFFPLCMQVLKLNSLPKIRYVGTLEQDIQPSFGEWDNNNNVLTIALKNRHPNDILRTLAHELVHYKQDQLGMIKPDSGATGSPIENEANAVAGIIMRHFNKKFPHHLTSKPI